MPVVLQSMYQDSASRLHPRLSTNTSVDFANLCIATIFTITYHFNATQIVRLYVIVSLINTEINFARA